MHDARPAAAHACRLGDRLGETGRPENGALREAPHGQHDGPPSAAWELVISHKNTQIVLVMASVSGISVLEGLEAFAAILFTRRDAVTGSYLREVVNMMGVERDLGLPFSSMCKTSGQS